MVRWASLLMASALLAAPVRLPVVADTNLSSYTSERPFNYGGSSQARIKGYEMFYLARFDLTPLAGRGVVSARFWFQSANHRLRTLGFSTVASPWVEGTARGEAAATGATFLSRGDGQPWARPGGDFTDVAWTVGHTVCSYADLQTEQGGWLSAEVAPALVDAMVSGASDGLCISDEKGQTRFNNDLFTREQNARAPYLSVEVGPPPPLSVSLSQCRVSPWPEQARAGSGAARLSFELLARPEELARLPLTLTVNGQPWPRWRTPAPRIGRNDILLDDLPADAEVSAQVRCAAASLSARGPASPARGVPSLATPAKAAPATGTTPFAVPGWMSVNPLSGEVLGDEAAARLNSVWSAEGISLTAARGEIVTLQVVGATADPPTLTPLAAGNARLAVEPPQAIWYLEKPLVAEYAVPEGKARSIAGQRFWPHLVEIDVPADAAPGDYRATWQVGGQPVPVRLTVWRHALPATLSFQVALNSYGRVHGQYGIADGTSEAAIATERAYHRLAHRYRCTWQPLGYGHSGTQDWAAGPALGADGRLDWTDYDRRWGALFDGSAFAGLPRAGVPLAYAYLPFAEHWPTPMTAYGYQPTVTTWPDLLIEHAMKAPPIEQAFPADYQARFMATVRLFARHVADKGWGRTEFQGYLNDKYDYRNPKQGGRGVSWWLLDEPAHRDDWLALGWYGRLFAQGKAGVDGARFTWRADVSRPQWQRDWLDGSMELAVFGNEFYHYHRRMSDWLAANHARCWTYGTANDPGQPNLQTVAWCLRAWLAGADGVVPWNAIGTDRSYDEADPTGLLVPGRRVGVDGPVVSLRVLAFLAGQQECERLAALASARGWTREQMSAAAAPLLNLEARAVTAYAEDAGALRFEQVRAGQIDALRRAVAAELESKP